MALQERTILAAIDSRLTALRASGQSLYGIKSHYVKYTNSDDQPDMGSKVPALIVEVLSTTGDVVSIPACMTRMTTQVRFALLTEVAGKRQDTTAAVLLDAVFDAFWQQQLGVSNMIVNLIQKDYTLPDLPLVAPENDGGGVLVLEYIYTDVRAVP